MKCEPLTTKPAFTPIVLTLETAEEAAAIYALLNHMDIIRSIEREHGDDSERLEDAIKEAGNNWASISNQAGKYHTNLCAIIK